MTTKMLLLRTFGLSSAFLGAASVLGCSEDSSTTTGGTGNGTGTVEVFLAPEANITTGMEPGTEPGTLADGWTVTYSKFLLAFGNFDAYRSSDPSTHLRDERVFVVDIKNTSQAGLVLHTFENVSATRWDKVSFDVPNTPSTALKGDGVTEADFTMMKTQGYSAYIVGTATKPGGMSCRPGAPTDCVARETVSFAWGVKYGQRYGECGPEEGDSGFAVPSGGTVQLQPTFHGDHWFLSNFASHSAALYAQWIADSDTNRDGETTLAELEAISGPDLFPAPKYNLSAFPDPITSGADYLESGLRTTGHFQGEGECNDRTHLP